MAPSSGNAGVNRTTLTAGIECMHLEAPVRDAVDPRAPLLPPALPTTLPPPPGSPQMRPRWMAFVGRLFTPDSYLVAILKVPTVVMSRNADQQSKVCQEGGGCAPTGRARRSLPFTPLFGMLQAQSLLWGKVMPLSSTSLDYTPFIDHVKGYVELTACRCA